MPTGVYIRTKKCRKILSKAHLGEKHTKEHNRKIGQSLLGNNWNKGKKRPDVVKQKIRKTMLEKGINKDEKHGMWKGDKVGYIALHEWIRNKLGKAKRCSNSINHKSKQYVWSNISGEYKRDLSDWKEVCQRCNYFDGVKVAKRFEGR